MTDDRPDAPPPDNGAPENAPPDNGAPDNAPPDGGPPENGPLENPTLDSGTPDSGPSDRDDRPTDPEPRPTEGSVDPVAAATAPAPALVARGLGARGESDWLFRDVDMMVPPGAVAAIVGPAGSGRSSLLLTLAGRMRPAAGTLSVLGHALADDGTAVRELTSVARAAGVIGPEPALTVRESVGERCLIDDVPEPEGWSRFERACAAMQYAPDPAATVESVVGAPGTLLAVALAFVRTSAVILLDDVDRDIPVAGRAGLLQALRRLAETGVAVVVTAVDRSAVEGADPIAELAAPAGRTEWSFDPDRSTDPAAAAIAAKGESR